MTVAIQGTPVESVRTATTDPYTFSFDAGTNPRGVVLVCTQNGSTDNIVTVTYGGVSLSRSISVADTAGEPGRVYIYFGRGMPSGTNDFSIDFSSATGDDMQFTAVALSAVGDTMVIATNSTSGDLTNPSIALAVKDFNSMAFGGVFSGQNDPASITQNGNMTNLFKEDYGTKSASIDRQTNVSTSDFTFSYTIAVEDTALAAISITEAPQQFAQAGAFINTYKVHGQAAATILATVRHYSQAQAVIDPYIIYVYDSFNRANQTYLGQPDIGGPWSESVHWLIESNTGRFTANEPNLDSTGISWPAPQDGDLLVHYLGPVISPAGSDFVRFMAGFRGYYIDYKITETTQTINLIRSLTSVANTSITPITTAYLRVQVIGPPGGSTLARVKIWETSEPDAWTLTYNDPNGLSIGGAVALEAETTVISGGQQLFDNIRLAKAPAFQGYAQAQALIISSGIIKVYAQAQANILQTYSSSAQAQVSILQIYTLFAQAQAQIKQVYNGFAQSQAQIKQVYNGFAQAQAQIKQLYNSYAQAQANILQTYNNFAQAQGSILQVYNPFAQAQAVIIKTYDGYGQAQAKINAFDVNGYGQSQGTIKATYNGYAQANADILATSTQYGQAQTSILNTYQGYAQSQAQIKQIYNAFAQAQGSIIATYNGLGQAQADILAVGYGFANAQAGIKQIYTFSAQGQADILSIYQGYAQTQGSIKSTVNGYGQAQSNILQTYLGFAQTQSQIKQIYLGFAQAQGTTLQTYSGYAQAQAKIEIQIQISAGFGQATADILAVSNGYGQSNADILVTTNGYAQAQALIRQTYAGFAQAQAYIKTTQQGYSQAIADIKQTYNEFAQGQANIKATSNGFAQAQAAIEQTYQSYAQAQALIQRIEQGYAQSQAVTRVTSSVSAQAQGSTKVTYGITGQAQAHISTNISVSAQAQAYILSGAGFGQAQAFIRIAHYLKKLILSDRESAHLVLSDRTPKLEPEDTLVIGLEVSDRDYEGG